MSAGPVDPPKEIFDAQLVKDLPPDTRVSIDSELNSNVVVDVLVYPDDPAISGNEVAVDYARTSWAEGINEETAKEAAAVNADKDIQVTLNPDHNIVRIDIKSAVQPSRPKDTAIVHVRVPPRTQLAVTVQVGNVRAWGDMSDVEVHVGRGNIEVRGATGSLRLDTKQGSIWVDELRYQPTEQGVLDLAAAEGNIDIYAVNVSAKAATTKGNIRFVGSLAQGADHHFKTTEGGNITLALPSDLPYTYRAVGGKQVMNDYISNTLVCGDLGGNMFDTHAQVTQSDIGHTTIGRLITTTDWVTGTLFPNNYFLFYTNRAAVAKFMPEYGRARQQGGALWTPECDEPARRQELANIRFTVETGKSGIIDIRLIRKH